MRRNADFVLLQLSRVLHQLLGEDAGQDALSRLCFQQFAQLRSRPLEAVEPFQKIREESHLRVGGRSVFLHWLCQHPGVGVLLKAERQLPVLNVPARAVQCGLAAAPLALLQHEAGVCCAADTRGPGDHVQRILVVHLPQMMDEQDGDAVVISQPFQRRDVPVVTGVGIGVLTGLPYLLQRVDDHQRRPRML